MSPLDPTGQSGLASTKTVINVEFVPVQPQPVSITHRPKVPFWMPNLPPKKIPQLFPGFAGMELHQLPPNFRNTLSPAPLTAVGPAPRPEYQAAPLWRETHCAGESDRSFKRQASGRSMPPPKKARSRNKANIPSSNLKQAKFTLAAPWAKSVKLAADFTAWQKYPLDMIKGDDGVWHIVVWVLPGQHAYRFIVDGQWYDDPNPAHRIANPFGTADAVIQVE